MKTKYSKLVLIIILSITIKTSIQAQVFSGFNAFKNIIEFEGQRYLMEDVYQIKSEDFDKLKINKTIKEIDSNEGFMFIMSSYKFNEKSGIVISSFVSTSFTNTSFIFVNIHLTTEEYTNLINTFDELAFIKLDYDEHVLRKFNNSLIVDVHNTNGIKLFTLWIENQNRHTFSIEKWEEAFRRHVKFLEK